MSKKWKIVVLAIMIAIPLGGVGNLPILAFDEVPEEVTPNGTEINEDVAVEDIVQPEETSLEDLPEVAPFTEVSTPEVPSENPLTAPLVAPLNAQPRGVYTVFTATTLSGERINYFVLSEDTVTKTGTVEVGNGNNRGLDGVTTNGNGLKAYPTNGILHLDDTVTNGGYTYTVVGVGDYALSDGRIKEIKLPTTLQTIGVNAMRNNLLTSLTIPEGVTRVGDMALCKMATLKVVKFPTTIKSLGSGLFQNNTGQRTVYFPVDDAEFRADDPTRTNNSFFGMDTGVGVVVVNTKEQYEKWRKATPIVHATETQADYMVTYEVDVEFYDKELNKLALAPVKKLYKKIASYTKGSDEAWEYATPTGRVCTDLPALPLASELGYTAKYWGINEIGVSTVDAQGNIKETTAKGGGAYSDYFNIIDNKMVALEAEMEVVGVGVDKTFDDTLAGVSLSFNRTLDKGYFLKDYIYTTIFLSPKGSSYGGYRYTSFPAVLGATKDANAVKGFKNVADSGTYAYSMVLYDKISVASNRRYIAWMSHPSGGATDIIVDIKPATINITPKLSYDSATWENQTSLPTLLFSEGDTQGTITWDAGQEPKKGIHDYFYTFVPNNLYADGVKGTNIANYTEVEKKGKFTIEYKEAITHKVKFLDINGNVVDTQTVEDTKAAVAPALAPVSGYTFVGWDTDFSNVTSDLNVRAMYTKNETPPVVPTPPVNTPVNPSVNPPVTPVQPSPPVVAEADTKETDKKVESGKGEKKPIIENKQEGIVVESINKEKVFGKDEVVVIVDSKNKDKKAAEQKLENIIRVFDVIVEKNGVKVEKVFGSKIRVTLDAKDYEKYKDLKVHQKDKDGNYTELTYEIKDGKITFECDGLDTYVLTGIEDQFPWWIVVASIIGLLGLFLIVWKVRDNKKEE